MRLLPLTSLLCLALAGPTQALDVVLTVGEVQWPQHPPLRAASAHCRLDVEAHALHCRNGALSATLPELGKVDARLEATALSSRQWHAQATLQRTGESLPKLQKLAQRYAFTVPGTMRGRADLSAVVRATPETLALQGALQLRNADYSEPSGRYATEKWNAHLDLGWRSDTRRWTVQGASRSGQLYVEPLYLDFAALQTTLQFEATALPTGWRIDALRLQQGAAATVTGGAQLDAHYGLRQLALTLDAAALQPVAATDVQPFLIGTQFEGLDAEGALTAQLQWTDGQPAMAAIQPRGASLSLPKLGFSLRGIDGDLRWSATARTQSTLRWQDGSAQKIAFGPAQFRFVAQARDFDLLEPARIPLLDGALDVERLALHRLGGAAPQADFSGALQAINLTALCEALGWPAFGGTLSGRLPGLSIRDNVWQLEGTLTADAFDGRIEFGQLRAIDPFGVLPRITTDIRLRRLDLESLTRVFSFGRITGRLDGDIEGLRLLAWKPVAFDARLYSSPDDDKPHRISQRAIDNISSIGGGPTGVLSRGFLSLFEDFAYSRMGLGCVLRDGRCRMSGVEAAGADGEAYAIVEGRLLPRIDVVGYAREVSWSNLLSQLDAARKSSGPSTRQP